MNHRPTIDEDCEHIRKKRRIDNSSFFEDLPDELLERILTIVYPSKYARFVCWKWLGIVSDISFMKSTCIQRWGEDIGPIKYERISSDKKQTVIDEYYIPLVKDDSEGYKVDWNRYYKIRSNYEKFLFLERLDNSSILKKDNLKKVISSIHYGNISDFPEVSYRAIRFLCDLARINIEQNNIKATEFFVVPTWKQDPISNLKSLANECNTKICHCLFNLYHIAKNTTERQLKWSLMQKILNRFVNSTLDVQILIWLMEEMLGQTYFANILSALQSWYSGLLSSKMSSVPTENEELSKQINTLYEAIEKLFKTNTNSEQKIQVVEIGLSIADQTDPEFAVKLFRLVADQAKQNESFEEDSLMLLSKVAMECNSTLGDEEYIYLLEVALRKRKILLSEPIPQLYMACSLLDNLNESRVQLFNDEDLNVWHRAFFSLSLEDIQKNDLIKGCVQIISKITLFGSRITPFLPDYDKFLLEGQTHNPKLAVFYLCDVLGKFNPDKAMERLNFLMTQRTYPMLVDIIAEGYDRFKAIFGDVWATKNEEMMLNVILESFPEDEKNLKVKKIAPFLGKWKFRIEHIDQIVVPKTISTSYEDKAIKLLMRYANSHSSTMTKSVQIQILNTAICCYYRGKSTLDSTLLYSMPIIHSEPISDIAPQLLELLKLGGGDSKLLLKLVLSYPCAVFNQWSQGYVGYMKLVRNKAIIASYFGVQNLRSWDPYNVLLDEVTLELRVKYNDDESYKILLHYAIQLRCACWDMHDDRVASYCEYAAHEHWPIMKTALLDNNVRAFILQFMDDYDAETNFLRDLLPKYDKLSSLEQPWFVDERRCQKGAC